MQTSNREFGRRACLTSSLTLTTLLTLAPMAPLAANEGFHPGPVVGDAIPTLEAMDQDGKARAFQNLTGPNGLLLLVHRSADW